MTGFGAAFVDGDNHLTDHHLGDIVLQFFFPNNTNVACNFLLRDQGIDEGVNMWANGVVLFFRLTTRRPALAASARSWCGVDAWGTVP